MIGGVYWKGATVLQVRPMMPSSAAALAGAAAVRAVLATVLLAALALASPGADALAQERVGGTIFLGDRVVSSIVVPINQSQVIETAREITQVSVGNPAIADVAVLGPRSVYVFARSFGETSMTLTDEAGRVISVVEIEVARGTGLLKRKLHNLLPGERIAVHAVGEGLVLTGQVASGAIAANAVMIAEQYAPGAVINQMQVVGSQQVMLAVHFVEMRREGIKKLGLNVDGVFGGSGAVSGFIGATNVLIDPLPFGLFGLNVTAGNTNIDVFLDLLEQKGIIRTLAEPNLVAMSGDTASFLAGGEFPIPVGQDEEGITIEFKPFGVGLGFTPTLVGGDLINLDMSMEVSEIDPANSIRVSAIEIPGLTVRRATTTVELRSGQSFAIAGLLSETFQDEVRQVPYLGDIPILGALVRSTQYQAGQTELVMIVTPHVVQPTTLDRLALPGYFPPSEKELFLFGDVEGGGPGNSALHPNAGLVGQTGYALQ